MKKTTAKSKTASRGAKKGGKKARRPAMHGVTKWTYYVFYYFSYGVVFAGEVVVDLLPDNHVIRRALRDGAKAAQEDREEAKELAHDIELVEEGAEVMA